MTLTQKERIAKHLAQACYHKQLPYVTRSQRDQNLKQPQTVSSAPDFTLNYRLILLFTAGPTLLFKGWKVLSYSIGVSPMYILNKTF